MTGKKVSKNKEPETKIEVSEISEIETESTKKKTVKTKKAEKTEKKKLKKSEAKHSKKYREVLALVDLNNCYTPEEAVALAKKTSVTKFDSSVEFHINLNLDLKNSEQQVRGSLVLPAGTGKTKKVCAIVSTEKEKEAKDAGADFVGGGDLIAKIEKGWLDFDIVVATPDMMAQLGKIGKILGTKGLMPNPKIGTVTQNVGNIIKEIKKGMVEYRADKNGIIHLVIGKVSFSEKDLLDNFNLVMETIIKAKPSGVKGTYINSVSISTTMGPGIKVLYKN
jgi:large subunit ribosomal protein L1